MKVSKRKWRDLMIIFLILILAYLLTPESLNLVVSGMIIGFVIGIIILVFRKIRGLKKLEKNEAE